MKIINAFVAASLDALMMASATSADFTGLSLEFTGNFRPGSGFAATRIYANFSNPGDRLLSIIGANYAPHPGSSFYQNPLGGDVEPNPFIVALFPDVEWDSFVTIGHTVQVAGEATSSLDPDGEWSDSGFTGGYFVPGDAPQGLAGFELKILIAQLTFQDPGLPEGASGSMTIAWEAASGAVGTQFSKADFDYFHPDPAPGTLTLLGIAGLAGSRRRR